MTHVIQVFLLGPFLTQHLDVNKSIISKVFLIMMKSFLALAN